MAESVKEWWGETSTSVGDGTVVQILLVVIVGSSLV